MLLFFNNILDFVLSFSSIYSSSQSLDYACIYCKYLKTENYHGEGAAVKSPLLNYVAECVFPF